MSKSFRLAVLTILLSAFAPGPVLGQSPEPPPKTDPIPIPGPPIPGPPAPNPDGLISPRASVVGPNKPVDPDSPVFLDASSSVSVYPLRWVVNPVVPTIKMGDDKRVAIYGLIPPPLTPGTTYIVTVTALGKDDRGEPLGESWTVQFTTRPITVPTPVPVPIPTPVPTPTPTPVPTPVPTPTPTPTPTPDPDPAPVPPAVLPVSGPIFATLYYSTGDVSTLPLRLALTDPAGPSAAKLAALTATWHAYDDQSHRIVNGSPSPNTIIADQGLGVRYAAIGGGPAIFLQDSAGKILKGPPTATDPTGEIGYGILKPVPANVDDVAGKIKMFRGAK